MIKQIVLGVGGLEETVLATRRRTCVRYGWGERAQRHFIVFTEGKQPPGPYSDPAAPLQLQQGTEPGLCEILIEYYCINGNPSSTNSVLDWYGNEEFETKNREHCNTYCNYNIKDSILQ